MTPDDMTWLATRAAEMEAQLTYAGIHAAVLASYQEEVSGLVWWRWIRRLKIRRDVLRTQRRFVLARDRAVLLASVLQARVQTQQVVNSPARGPIGPTPDVGIWMQPRSIRDTK